MISPNGEFFSHSGISVIADDRITSLQLRLQDARDLGKRDTEEQVLRLLAQQCEALGRDLRLSLAAAPGLAQL